MNKPCRVRNIRATQVHTNDGQLRLLTTLGGGVPVVFVAGAGCWSDHWVPVLKQLPNEFSGLAYDRPGIGGSSPARGRRTVHSSQQDLLRVIDSFDIEKAILVGHSAGASAVRMFALAFPERVLGLLFVDGWHESFAQWQEGQGQSDHDWQESLLLFAGRLGVFSLLNRLWPEDQPSWCESNEDWRRISRASSSRQFFTAMQEEMQLDSQIDRYLAKQSFSLTSPVSCLVCTQTLSAEEVPEGYPIDEHNAAWFAASGRLAGTSRQASVIEVHEGGHMFLLNQPEIVVNAIQQLAHRI